MGVEDTRRMQDDTKRTGIGRFTEALDSTGQSRRSTTASDVAIRAGVSQSAVSRCFTPGASVSERMRDRVMQAAQALGYRPNLIARSLITRRSGMIGVAVGSVAQHLYPGTLQALATRLQAEGYRILLFTAPPDGQADPALEQIMAYQVDALILAAATVSSQLATQCRAAGIPVVLYNRTVRGQAASSVTCTNRIAGTEIAALFAAGGHRRPAFIAFDPSASTSRDRERGFREGCRTYGLPDPVIEVGASTDAGARQAMTALLRRRDPPDAVFCAFDQMAIVALDVARYDFGLSVPRDVSIAGFDDTPPAAWPSYALTTYAQPVAAMVDATVDLILEQLADPRVRPRRIEVPGHLVLRQSCRLPASQEITP